MYVYIYINTYAHKSLWICICMHVILCIYMYSCMYLCLLFCLFVFVLVGKGFFWTHIRLFYYTQVFWRKLHYVALRHETMLLQVIVTSILAIMPHTNRCASQQKRPTPIGYLSKIEIKYWNVNEPTNPKKIQPFIQTRSNILCHGYSPSTHRGAPD